MMRVCVLGTGYVGLVSGACLAEVGHDVVCVDVDASKVGMINRGESPIFEQGLDEILRRQVGKRLRATTSLAEGFRDADVLLLCVGTPFDGARIDLSYVSAAAEEVGALLRTRSGYCVVAVKSTVIPGTTDGLVRDALERTSGRRAGVDFGLGMNPEFLAEGVAVRDFMQPDRIVLGGIDERSVDVLAELYAPFAGVPIVRADLRTAETIKYASNAFLATLISFSNELARYCEAVGGVDVADVMRGVHLMKHLTYRTAAGERACVSAASFLWSGCGFGGSCFPKDVRALISDAERHGCASPILKAVIEVNETQPDRMLELLASHFRSLMGVRVAVLGLAFKPGTDDVRESPALKVVPRLVAAGANVVCHDPIAIANAKLALEQNGVALGSVGFEGDVRTAVADADAILLITSWPDYADVVDLLAQAKRSPLLVDGRRFLDRRVYARYVGIGQGRTVARDAAGSSEMRTAQTDYAPA